MSPSSPDRLGEPVTAEPQQPLRHADVAGEANQVGCWPIGRAFPKLLTDGDLMLVFGLGHSRYALLKKQGRFRSLEVHPAMAGRTRYSGHLVEQYVRGEWTAARTFGRKRA